MNSMSQCLYWLMKSEPDVYSIDRLAKDQRTLWTGVRNYQARNFMMQEMQVGQWVLFYHSNTDLPGVAGLAKVARKAVPDPEQFDKKSDYYDAKSTLEKPRWWCVEVAFQQKFKRVISLEEMRNQKALKSMLILRPGNRLSITPVTAGEYDLICQLAAV